MVTTNLSPTEFAAELETLSKLIELRTVQPDTLNTRLEHLREAQEVDSTLKGLRMGTYDHPAAWLQALIHLKDTDQILYLAPDDHAVQQPIEAGLPMDPSRRIRWLQFALGLAVAACFAAGFVLLNSMAIKSCFLMIASALALVAFFSLFRRFLPLSTDVHSKRMASATAMVIAATFYLQNGESLAGLALAWMLLVYGAIGSLVTLQWAFMDGISFKLIYQDYKNQRPLDAKMPLVYVLSEPGFGVWMGNRLAAKTAQALWRYQFRPHPEFKFDGSTRVPGRATLARLLSGGRMLVYFILSDTLRKADPGFQEWLLRRCGALVIICAPADLDGDVASTQAGRHYTQQLDFGLQHTPGPIFYFRITPGQGGDAPTTDSIGARADVVQVMPLRQSPNMGELIAPLVQRLASTVVPMYRADAGLSIPARKLSERLGGSAVPQIADTYLRLRLAQSDVERFLVLLEGIELVLKLSVVVLALHAWSSGSNASDKLDSPNLTLGSWDKALNVCLTCGKGGSEKVRLLVDFWVGDVFGSQQRVTEVVSQLQLAESLGEVKSNTQLGWIYWFIKLRNVTRGHGVVEEAGIGKYWRDLYGCFLDMLAALEGVFLSNAIGVGSGSSVYPIAGWLRSGRRASGPDKGEEMSARCDVFVGYGGDEWIRAYPLLVFEAQDICVWDGWSDRSRESFEVLNFRTGERSRRVVGDMMAHDYQKSTALRRLWAAEDD